MFIKALLLASGLPSLSTSTPLIPRNTNLANAETAYTRLQQWYDPSTGLWSEMWWHSGNILSTLSNLATLSSNLHPQITSLLSNTYTAAQAYTYDAKPSPGFTGAFYDDEAWWALGFIAAYDLTGTTQYLSTAETIFDDMYASFGKTGCGANGGIWWDKAQTYVNAIANELFLSLAAHLANRVQGKNYEVVAKQQWEWFQGSGLVRQDWQVVDGLQHGSCEAGTSGWTGTVWSYNQGVVLGALVELSRATGDDEYLQSAQQIADSAISHLADPNGGILREICEFNDSCDGDQTQFKGVFVRNLMELEKATSMSKYATFLDSNAESLWTDGQEDGLMSVNWNGPFLAPANASTQSSGLDCLVAALAT